MKKKQIIDYSKNIDYIDYYIKELESRHGDIDEINELKILKQRYLEQNNENNFKNNLKVQLGNKKSNNVNSTNKKKIKRPSLKKQAAIGVLVGVIIGIPSAMISYNYMMNLPSTHNYTTVREKRKNLKHDDSNYRKYLKKIGLTEQEIEDRIEQEEIMGMWSRDDER